MLALLFKYNIQFCFFFDEFLEGKFFFSQNLAEHASVICSDNTTFPGEQIQTNHPSKKDTLSI